MKQDDDSRPGTFKSGGQRIDDHSFWAGKPGKDSRFPDGPYKTKNESTAEGAGNVMKYEDTTEAIRASQVEASRQVKSKPMKQPDYRN